MLHFSLIRSGLGEEKKGKRMDPHDKTRKSFIASLNRERHKNEIYASYILLLNFTLKKNKKNYPIHPIFETFRKLFINSTTAKAPILQNSEVSC